MRYTYEQMKPAHKMTIQDKEQLFHMANTAVKEGANFITFPEFFIPIVWLKDLTRFAQKNNVYKLFFKYCRVNIS